MVIRLPHNVPKWERIRFQELGIFDQTYYTKFIVIGTVEDSVSKDWPVYVRGLRKTRNSLHFRFVRFHRFAPLGRKNCLRPQSNQERQYDFIVAQVTRVPSHFPSIDTLGWGYRNIGLIIKATPRTFETDLRASRSPCSPLSLPSLALCNGDCIIGLSKLIRKVREYIAGEIASKYL